METKEIMVCEDPLALLQACGAIKDGHFVLTPKKVGDEWKNFHAGVYVDKDAAYWQSVVLWRLAYLIARHYVGIPIDVVIGPEMGAVGLAPMVAIHLTMIQEPELLPPWGCVASCWANKDGVEQMAIKRGAFIAPIQENPGLRALVAEDIGTSGGSALKTITAARNLGMIVEHVSFLAARQEFSAEDLGGAAPYWLVLAELEKWPEESCPLCHAAGPESVDLRVGKGLDFLRRIGLR